MILKVEPMPEPCIILRVMGWDAEKPSISCFADLANARPLFFQPVVTEMVLLL